MYAFLVYRSGCSEYEIVVSSKKLIIFQPYENVNIYTYSRNMCTVNYKNKKRSENDDDVEVFFYTRPGIKINIFLFDDEKKNVRINKYLAAKSLQINNI